MELYYHNVDNSVLILIADGGLNADTSTSFVNQLGVLIENGVQKIIVDCSRLEYISSYGIGVLIRVHKKLAERGGDVKIAAAKGTVLKILEVTRINRILDIYSDVSQAQLAFRPRNQPKSK